MSWCKTGGRGYGHFCANILPANGKEGWALAWKEKVDEAAGSLFLRRVREDSV